MEIINIFAVIAAKHTEDARLKRIGSKMKDKKDGETGILRLSTRCLLTPLRSLRRCAPRGGQSIHRMLCCSALRIPSSGYAKAKSTPIGVLFALAERQGFEPWVPFGTRHFECRTIDHSDISPHMLPMRSHGQRLVYPNFLKNASCFRNCSALPKRNRSKPLHIPRAEFRRSFGCCAKTNDL